MKSLFASIALLICAVAHADTLSLQIPVSHFNPICGYAPFNEQTVTGFSADGNYVFVQAHGYTTCGSSGRGSTVQHAYWCDLLTFDLSGNLVSQTALKPATYAGFNSCPWADPHASFTNAAGYLGFTLVETYNYTLTAPQLETP